MFTSSYQTFAQNTDTSALETIASLEINSSAKITEITEQYDSDSLVQSIDSLSTSTENITGKFGTVPWTMDLSTGNGYLILK